jgi:hypothetical protein
MEIKLEIQDLLGKNLEEEDILFFMTLIGLKKEMLNVKKRKITIFEAGKIFFSLKEAEVECPNFSVLIFKEEKQIK